ncbi:MAG: penicillin acylase family protein [Acidimicrobiia bacterium]|nr:penicillin acylase family protein [Acidimicrobiia bacterium]
MKFTGVGSGSNNWAIAGSRTRVGTADRRKRPHLSSILPAHWYLGHITTPDFEVAGASMAGTPVSRWAITRASLGASPPVRSTTPTCSSKSSTTPATRCAVPRVGNPSNAGLRRFGSKAQMTFVSTSSRPVGVQSSAMSSTRTAGRSASKRRGSPRETLKASW